ncbi:MAG: hypothetical protein K2K06_02350 [Oscillospiraceae bacterium]|nr:hypothetical protein [Oscillospiraceae bacterium]
MGAETVRSRLYYMWMNTLCTKIEVMGNLDIRFTNYVDDWLMCAFGRSDYATVRDYESFLEDRCFPRTRDNCDELLACIGLKHYSPIDIIMVTHGVQHDDHFWIRFDDQEDLTWERISRECNWRGCLFRNSN